MKDIKTKIIEGKAKSLVSEVQNDYTENAAYQTFGVSKEARKYKYGFLTHDEKSDSVIVTVFNSVKDLVDLLGTDEGTYDELEKLKVGESTNIENLGFTSRIW